MAFRFSNFKGYFSAEVKNNELIVHVAKDTVFKYPLPLDEDMPLQTRAIKAGRLSFWLESEKYKYVGRVNGTYSKYTKDNLLIYTKAWVPPSLLEVGSILLTTEADTVLTVPGHNNLLFAQSQGDKCYVSSVPLELERISFEYLPKVPNRIFVKQKGGVVCDITDACTITDIWRKDM